MDIEKNTSYNNNSKSTTAAAHETGTHAQSMPAVPAVQAKSKFAKGGGKPADKKPLDQDGIADMVKAVTTQRKTDSAFVPAVQPGEDTAQYSMQAFNPKQV
ncbi:hypothetical protein [Sediminibacterium ginsengisoli]|uniref:Uncharacterized protein n=1 Tax=Sediminibacterium ginsengisoli TaxID=413434 RepID=A0A1T4PM74_9BACT|nr:hypothetical protein [Sediminibacterium ginsengisoli]SJZ92461.1 hypothetical protein SAMN04488132_10681 [Sediminibacterium ginsengisoli]